MAKTRRNSHRRQSDSNSKTRVQERQLDIEEVIKGVGHYQSTGLVVNEGVKLDMYDIKLNKICIVRARKAITGDNFIDIENDELFVVARESGRFYMESERGKWSEIFLRTHLFRKSLGVVCYG